MKTDFIFPNIVIEYAKRFCYFSIFEVGFISIVFLWPDNFCRSAKSLSCQFGMLKVLFFHKSKDTFNKIFIVLLIFEMFVCFIQSKENYAAASELYYQR